MTNVRVCLSVLIIMLEGVTYKGTYMLGLYYVNKAAELACSLKYAACVIK